MSFKYRFASLSDVHLGHHNTPTSHILRNLRREFPDTEETGKLDTIYIVGDLFDRLLTAPDPDVGAIKLWLFSFLTMCARRDIQVRVLEGTKSHDWGQNKLVEQVKELANIQVDLKYIDTLSIEYNERYGIHVLYVPDDWRPDTDTTWMEVLQLLQAHGLEKVDYAFVHGSFDHQLPPLVKSPKHLGDRYLSITKHYICVGHVHIHSVYGMRLLANGSFDRISHGEEEAKGHWRVAVGGEDGDEIVFVENKGAQLYKTIDCTGLTVEEALKKLEVVKDFPEGSFVRVAAASGDPIMSSLDVLRKTYAHIKSWGSKETKEKDVQSKLLTDMRSEFTELHITEKNILDLLMARISAKTADDRLLSRCRKRLEEMLS